MMSTIRHGIYWVILSSIASTGYLGQRREDTYRFLIGLPSGPSYVLLHIFVPLMQHYSTSASLYILAIDSSYLARFPFYYEL